MLPKSSVSFFSLVSSFRVTIFLYLLFCLYDESKYFTLRPLNHSFLFCECPCTRYVACRGSYCCVEQSETVFEHEVSRCQLLSVLVERLPGSPDSISDFGRLLLLESNHLAQEFRAFSSPQYFELYVIHLNFFSGVRALVTENFRLPWMDPRWILSPTFSVLLMNSHNIFWRCSLEDTNKSTSSANHVCESVMVVFTQVDSHTFFLLPTWNVVFQCFLQNRVEEQA